MNERLILLQNSVENGLTINEAAANVHVSNATIRNWIKTRYLTRLTNGLISKQSFENFVENVAGYEKLNSRANKSRKDSHDHNRLSELLLEELESGNTDIDYIGDRYEELLSNSFKNKEGIYYTPTEIVKDLLRDYQYVDKNNLTFCDPACGSGNFLIEALEIGFKPENIFGFDTDPVAVEISKARIKDKTGFDGNNILNADFLNYSANKKCRYDYIFTNPPWGKKLDKNVKKQYGTIFDAGNCLDTSALFFFASMRCLNDDGFAGLLLPESFFNISVFEIARKKALDYSIIRFIDYGKSFSGLQTKAQALILKNSKNANNNILCEHGKKRFFRAQNKFRKNPKSIFNFYCSDSEAEIIDHIFSAAHTTLKDKAQWGIGIVTGNNSKYCIDRLQENYMPVYKGSDITINKLKEPSTFIPKDTSLYQQVAPISYYESDEKLIYKFISSKLCFFCETEKNYILNSANMVIINKNFPISSKQVASLLSSDLINWVFSKIFNTHKILKSDIEILPIHWEYFLKYSTFSEENYLDYLQLRKDENGTFRIKKKLKN